MHEAEEPQPGTVSRRAALRALGTGLGTVAALPWLSEEGVFAFARIQETNAAPQLKVLSRSQFKTLETLVEAIIPTDDRSPGAKQARVADYIDLLLSEADAFLRQQWLDGLAALDAEAGKRFGTPFVRLPEAQVVALLTDISQYELLKPTTADPAIVRNEQPRPPQVDTLLGDVNKHPVERTRLEAFFANTKQATIHGYYTSEIGIHKDLRYKGNQILAEFTGCLTVDGKDCPHCGRKAKA
jgi:hypothetical protein